MNADQITAFGGALAATITAGSAIVLRWTSKSTRANRHLRNLYEASLAYIWDLRAQLISNGIKPKRMPRELSTTVHDDEEGDA